MLLRFVGVRGEPSLQARQVDFFVAVSRSADGTVQEPPGRVGATGRSFFCDSPRDSERGSPRLDIRIGALIGFQP
jgi:hypothetical protein